MCGPMDRNEFHNTSTKNCRLVAPVDPRKTVSGMWDWRTGRFLLVSEPHASVTASDPTSTRVSVWDLANQCYLQVNSVNKHSLLPLSDHIRGGSLRLRIFGRGWQGQPVDPCRPRSTSHSIIEGLPVSASCQNNVVTSPLLAN